MQATRNKASTEKLFTSGKTSQAPALKDFPGLGFDIGLLSKLGERAPLTTRKGCRLQEYGKFGCKWQNKPGTCTQCSPWLAEHYIASSSEPWSKLGISSHDGSESTVSIP